MAMLGESWLLNTFLSTPSSNIPAFPADMDSPNLTPPLAGSFTAQSSRSKSSTKDDIISLTSFNPFSEEDEHDQSSYTIVTSLFSRMKNTLSAPLSNTAITPSNATTASNTSAQTSNSSSARRPSYTATQTNASNFSGRTIASDRPIPLGAAPTQAAPPVVSLTPAYSELPVYTTEYDRSSNINGKMPYSPSVSGMYSPGIDTADNAPFGTSIPGFPIADDARSIRTSTSGMHRSKSVSKVIRRLRGEGLSRDYWMDDENCKECYDCKSIFTTWRRKHHCRICGQIFCSRCASNIIKGARFGSEGMLRVCNLCLDKLAKVEDDDDDDRRSIISSTSNFPAHQLPQLPYASSQVFGPTEEPYALYSITEPKKQFWSSDDDSPSSRAHTPLGGGGAVAWEPVRDNPAPFRRAVSDEEKEGPQNSFNHSGSDGHGTEQPTKPIEIPDVAKSSIQFPLGSPEHLSTPTRMLPSRPSINTNNEFDGSTPFLPRSGLQSRFNSMLGHEGEPSWRTRRESTAYAQELNINSMLHLKFMLRQMLSIEGIPNIGEWEEVLLRLSLRIAREMTFTAFAQRQGQDMDVRRYVKIKKIPGGAPKDSEYVSGAVITKNVAHKSMSRFQNNPRVMLVTFPLEFSRVEGQYLHFAQIVRQEKEYLGNLASRIAALRPHIVLVEKSVSRIALEALAQHKIAVARAVKPSAIQTLARMTQGDIFSSIDKLALEPRLGHCARYSIQTYDHPLIPGRRKTYMRFEGCNRDMGCTIILRGADIDTLKRIKKVTRFLTFIVRNLKLETNLWKDLVAAAMYHKQAIPYAISVMLKLNVPKAPAMITPSSSLSMPKLLFANSDPQETPKESHFAREESPQKDTDMPSEDAEQLRLTRRIDESLEPYTKTFISVSATLRFPPPYAILWMKVLDNMLTEAKREWEDEVVKEERLIIQHKQEQTITSASVSATATPTPMQELPPSTPPSEDLQEADDRRSVFAQIEALPTLDLVSTPLLTPDGFPTSTQTDSDSYFTLDSLPSTPGTALIANPLAAPIAIEERETIKTAEDIFQESRYTLLKWKHDEFRRIWEWYLRKNPDDFVVEKYQCIHLREYTIPWADIGRYRPCFAPRATFIKFYGENDTTMGQFIEKHINDAIAQSLDAKAICTGKGCEQHLSRHAKVYVHNEHTISISVEKMDPFAVELRDGCTDRELGHSDIATFSLCRICGENTPFVYLSHEMLRYSFAKFLEIHAYPTAESIPGAGCTHNFFLHHTRYICWKEMSVRLQSDPVILHEIIYPPFRIRVRPETQLELKNDDFQRLHHRNMLWYSSLIDDLKLISIDAATGDEERDAVLTADINTLILRAEAERQDISKLINQTYRDSAPTDTLALNRVHAYRQDKIVAWQMDFDRLPKPRSVQSGTYRNSNRSSAFDSMRAMWPTRRSELAGAFENPNLPSSSVSEAEEELPSKLRRMTVDSSSASDASETEWKDEPSSKKESQAPISAQKEEEQASSDAVLTSDDQRKSDPDSDSTIGAPREPPAVFEDLNSRSLPSKELPSESGETPSRPSRLPRRASYNPSVADLVKKYQDYIPASGIQDLAETAMSPKLVVSESEQEYRSQMTLRPTAIRTKSRHRIPIRKPSTSDFEQGYAANVAPRYLSRRPPNTNTSRIPGPKEPVYYSPEFSRRASPEKRSSKPAMDIPSRPSSPSVGKYNTVATGKQSTKRVVSRTKDKSVMRPTSSSTNKATLRRAPAPPGTKVSNIAKHFERLGRDAERSKSRYAVIRGRRARPVASARAKVEVLDSVKDAIRDESESSDSSSEADDEDEGNDEDRRRISEEPIADLPTQKKDNDPPSSEANPTTDAAGPALVQNGQEEDTVLHAPSGPTTSSSPLLPTVKLRHDHNISPPASDMEGGGAGPERNSILKALSGFWPQPTRHSIETDDVLSDPEHIFRDSSMVVRLDEPTSIIALALSSTQYRDMLNKSRSEKKTAREARLNEMGETFMPDNASIAESTSTWGMVNLDTLDTADPTDDLRAPSSKLPWAITFESGGLTISCTVLYPEQFDALRRTYDCEKSMVESLSRCFNWNASGGKSGSAFLKTRDDRFIAKELSKPELQTMETFAPAYFDYMSSSVNANRPTLLAKVFGCFKVSYRKSGKDKGPNKSKSMQINLLVMENLFYDKRFSKIYDLKGSTRNRHVQSTGRENEVLLDENLVQAAYHNPLYLREHSKRILRGALYNDSKFLADINVMDYSLVCGVDSTNNELVIGIVDYIRTYTWDKKLESWVKESAFLGGAGKGEPTIVTPKQYRSRFLGAMERYFPLIPDRWMKQKDTPEEESVILSDLWPDW